MKKMFSEHYPNDCIIRVSNFIRLVDENRIRFDPPRGHMKSVLKEEWNIVGKIYDSKQNYCQVVTKTPMNLILIETILPNL